MKHLLFCLVLCVALCGIARAQSSVEPWLSLSADGRWDDYLPNASQGYVARVAPGAGVRLHTPRMVLRIEGLAAYDRYEPTSGTTDVPNSWNAHALARIDYRATRRLTLHAADAFADARDPHEIDRIGVVAPPGGLIVDTIADARAEYAASRLVTLDGGYAYRFTRFGDTAGMPTPGGDEHDVAGGAALRITPNDIARAGWRT